MKWLFCLLKLIGFKKVSIPLPSWYKVPVKIEDTDDMEKAPEISISREFIHAHPILVQRFKKLNTAFEETCPGKKLLVTCTHRSKEYQRKLYNQGRNGNPGKIVTMLDGFNKASRHNSFPAEALDIAIINRGKIVWPDAEEELYWPLIKLAAVAGLVYGGAWTKFPDFCHLEIDKNEIKKASPSDE